MFQHRGQFYWWRNPEYPEKTHRPVVSHWRIEYTWIIFYHWYLSIIFRSVGTIFHFYSLQTPHPPFFLNYIHVDDCLNIISYWLVEIKSCIIHVHAVVSFNPISVCNAESDWASYCKVWINDSGVFHSDYFEIF